MNTKKQGSINSYERLTEREKAIQLLEKVKQRDKGKVPVRINDRTIVLVSKNKKQLKLN